MGERGFGDAREGSQPLSFHGCQYVSFSAEARLGKKTRRGRGVLWCDRKKGPRREGLWNRRCKNTSAGETGKRERPQGAQREETIPHREVLEICRLGGRVPFGGKNSQRKGKRSQAAQDLPKTQRRSMKGGSSLRKSVSFEGGGDDNLLPRDDERKMAI